MNTRDQVWLEGKNLNIRGTRKLLPKQYGPFTIKEQIGKVAYRLDLPTNMRIHNVFHVDLLLPYKVTDAYGAHDAYVVIVVGRTHAHISRMCREKQHGPTGAYARMGQWRHTVHIHALAHW
jgi:hypothetical protein